jgi:hypothetical protein
VHVVGTAAPVRRGLPIHADQQDLDRIDPRPDVGDRADPRHQALDVGKPALPNPDHTASALFNGSSADIGCPSDLVRRPYASQLGAARDEP